MDEELGNKDTEEDYIYCTLLWREKIRINSRNHRKADSGSESKKKKTSSSSVLENMSYEDIKPIS